jgi:hypothetical protein
MKDTKIMTTSFGRKCVVSGCSLMLAVASILACSHTKATTVNLPVPCDSSGQFCQFSFTEPATNIHCVENLGTDCMSTQLTEPLVVTLVVNHGRCQPECQVENQYHYPGMEIWDLIFTLSCSGT